MWRHWGVNSEHVVGTKVESSHDWNLDEKWQKPQTQDPRSQYYCTTTTTRYVGSSKLISTRATVRLRVIIADLISTSTILHRGDRVEKSGIVAEQSRSMYLSTK